MLAIISHDAGGAEILASYVKRTGKACLFVLEGPAIRVFERQFGRIKLTLLAEAIDVCHALLCGSSWQSDLEWQALGEARRIGKSTTVFLDHWANYRERFIRNGVEHLPDAIYTGDPIAEKIAKECFPELPVSLIFNPYFEEIREQIAALPSVASEKARHGLRVLFVCEPLSEHGLRGFGDEHHWGYTEFDALRYFFACREMLGKPLEQLLIRPHPAELPGKYDAIAAEFGVLASIAGTRSLLEEIAESDVVVGCNSMAMVVGLIAGRRVISCIPPSGKPCILPHPEIESMQTLAGHLSCCSAFDLKLNAH